MIFPIQNFRKLGKFFGNSRGNWKILGKNIMKKYSDFLKFVCYILQHISITSIPNLDFAIDIETPRAARKLLPSMCYIEYCSITSKIWVEVNDFREILLISCYILQHISVTSIPNLDFSVDIEASRVVRKLLPNMCYIEYWSVPSKNWTEVAEYFWKKYVENLHENLLDTLDG